MLNFIIIIYNKMTRFTKLIALGVLVVCFVSFTVFLNLFLSMYIKGEAQILILADEFGEFWIEFVMFVLATIFAPVMLYELEDWIKE